MFYYHVLTHLPYLHMVHTQIVLVNMHMPHTHKYVPISYMSHAYFHGVFCWCININCTYIRYILLAHTNGSSLWNIHIFGTYTYVGYTFTPHTYVECFMYFNVKCTKSMLCTCCTFHMLEGCCIADVLEFLWVVICLPYMILIFIIFSLIVQLFLHKIFPFIPSLLWHLLLMNQIFLSCWEPINDVFFNLCLWHFLFSIRSCLDKIILIAFHTICSIYAGVKTMHIIIKLTYNSYINCPSFTLVCISTLPPISPFLYCIFDDCK
jgi:hypothetical protein